MMALAILRFIWRHKISFAIFLIFSVVLVYVGIKFSGARRDAADLARQLANYEVVTQIHEGVFLQQTAQLELAETLIREYSPQPTTELAYTAGVKVIYKTRTIRVPVVETKIVYRDENISISGDISVDKDDDKKGFIDLSYTLAPLKIDLFVTRVKGQYQTIVDTHDPDVTVEMTTRLDPAVFQDARNWFAGVGPLVRLHRSKGEYSWYDLGLAAEVGYLFNAWYIKGQIMYFDGFGVGVMFGGRW